MKLVEAEGLCVRFGQKEVLKGLCLEVEKGALLGIIGPSGSGKTTLLRILNGLQAPLAGTVKVLGKLLTYQDDRDLESRRQMTLVRQHPLAFRTTVWKNVAYPLELRGFKGRELQQKVDRALEQVELLELAEQPATTLSGGELQRMAFARATVHGPELLLLDEFTAQLDPYNVRLLEEAIVSYQKRQGATVVMVTHNLFQTRRLATTTAFLFEGTIIEQGVTEALLEEPHEQRTRQFVRGEMVF